MVKTQSIYIFGCEKNILKYSLESDSIFQTGTLLENFRSGTIQTDMEGNFLLFGAGSNKSQVLKYDVAGNSNSIVAELPWSIHAMPTVPNCGSPEQDIGDTVFILGGYPYSNQYKILSFDMINFNYTQSPNDLPIDLHAASAICVGRRAFVFPSHIRGSGSVWEINLDSHEMFPVGQPNVPYLELYNSAVSDNNAVFIVAGFYREQNQPIPSKEGIFRFDPGTNSTDFIPVLNWPVKNGESYFGYAPQCVFVQKLNRIVCFGGHSYNLSTSTWRDHDEIFYIDMSSYESTTLEPIDTTTMNPDWFSCINRTDGFYPHPTECSQFIGCRDEEMDHFTCVPPLLFNPLLRNCDDPEAVECGTSCIGRPDGHYPHPHDCSLYLICRSEVLLLGKCTSPLLFDPILVVCNYPDAANCSNE